MSTKQTAIAAAVAIGLAFGTPFTGTALAGSALPHTAQPSSPQAEFHNGDLVHLQLGSPLLTITGIQGDQATCVWVDPDGKLQSGQFPLALLTAPIPLPGDEE